MLKKIALGVLILLAICSLLLVGQIKLATYMYDNKLASVLGKIEKSVPGVKLDYEAKDSSFTERSGRLYYTVPLKKGNSLGVDSLSGAVDLRIIFGPLRVSGAVESVLGVGNLEEVLDKYNVAPIKFRGAFKVTAVTPKIEGSLKTDSFLIPNETGLCKLGQNALSFYATSAENVDIEFKSAGAVCEGALRYNDKPNYRLDLEGVSVKFLPRIVNKKPHFDSLTINLNNLDFKFSTLYAIGFSPDDHVKDPSLQDAISFTNVSTTVSLSPPDEDGMARLTFDNTGNYAFALPYIKDNVVQPYYRFDDFKLAGKLDRISIPIIYESAKNVMKNASERFDTNEVFHEVMRGFTDTIGITIDRFGYTHEGESFLLSGHTNVGFDMNATKPKLAKFDSDYKITADRGIVESMAGEEYKKALQSAVSAGQISFDGTKYSTDFRLQGKQVYLNNMSVTDLIDNDDDANLEKEELQAQKAEAARQKAEAEALRREAESVREAQKNLPSIVDGNLNIDNADHDSDQTD